MMTPKSCIVAEAIGPLCDPVTWYKITHAGEQVAQWDLQNNATRTSPPGPVFDFEVQLRNSKSANRYEYLETILTTLS